MKPVVGIDEQSTFDELRERLNRRTIDISAWTHPDGAVTAA
jgi:hypothetical protein